MKPHDPYKTHNRVTAPLDKETCEVTASFQWLLEKSRSHPITEGNRIETLICGQEGFGRIAQDIEHARGSLCIVCWGFDPGMALVRGEGQANYPWANGLPYGELLRRKAAEGVQVRLLVWYNGSGSSVQNNLVGYVATDNTPPGGTLTSTWDERNPNAKTPKPLADVRQDYCIHWWRDATHGRIPNLTVRCRDGVVDKVQASVKDEPIKPSQQGGAVLGLFDEQTLIEEYATHHQKPILIDYDHADGEHAVGYVMGLNSVTDYWDDAQHLFDSHLREQDFSTQAELKAAEEKGIRTDAIVQAALKAGQPISRKPFQDYACRIHGPALQDVWINFARAWNRATALLPLTVPFQRNRPPAPKQPAPLNAALNPSRLSQPVETSAASHVARLQILRTQPEEAYQGEKNTAYDQSIKLAYMHAASNARRYIYIENQYFFYEPWAEQLKTQRQSYLQAHQDVKNPCENVGLLHLMVVIPQPENAGMVPRTYDTIKALGHGDAMPGQQAAVTTPVKSSFLKTSERDIAAHAAQVKTPTLDKEGILIQDGKSLRMKVLIAKMATANPPGGKLGSSRDIYIHSKLMLVDDNFMTLGSANLNLRSMAADSEINVATDSIPHNRELRKRIWSLQTGGLYDGGNAYSDSMDDTFENWTKLAKANAVAIIKKQRFEGFLVAFKDERVAKDRVG
ncbi:phospholipase D-like domain-containing protein [Methylovorus sp. MP688]|uniref:phospholipase D-like domain-containing protein n=1 Tax=Methylovorus sp. (strain MP688) TaxID=887061 RepID=UPI0001EC4CA9|nr:phospholipase D-like domain-containing protein [Methylovorus sp. MP688]ADQ85522.1 phospholipase D/Transphosphatidylase [Methylovorus sp. MP688]